MKQIFSLISCILILGSCFHSSSENFSIAKQYNHDHHCFTQGFELYNGYIYESCGLYGMSYVQKYKPGKPVEIRKQADAKYFYEGLTIFQGKLYLLTWKSGDILILDPTNLEILATKKLPANIQEGWGITNNGKHLYISNGSKNIFIVDTQLEIKSTLSTDISHINELEYKNGLIYANIWKTSQIAIFGEKMGNIKGIYDFSEVSKNYSGEQVLNGITFLENGTMLITGKQWDNIFEIQSK